jgi:hypothetical protein
MKKIILTLLALSTYSAYAQKEITWEKTYGCRGNEMANDFIIVPDGYVFAGTSEAPCPTYYADDSTNKNGLIVKLDKEGKLMWSRNIGGSEEDVLTKILPTSDGGYLVGGTTRSANFDIKDRKHSSYESWITKLDAGGNVKWTKTYGGNFTDKFVSMVLTKDDGAVVLSISNSEDGDIVGHKWTYDYWLMRINSAGNIVWQRVYGGSNEDEPAEIMNTPDGGFILTGNSASDDGDLDNNHGFLDVWALKLNNFGDVEWSKAYGGKSVDGGRYGLPTKDGGYLFAAVSKSGDIDVTNAKGDYDLWMVKTNRTGEIEWEKSYGSAQNEWMPKIKILESMEGGYTIMGSTYSNTGDIAGKSKGGSNIWILKITETGDIQWSELYGEQRDDFAANIYQLPDYTYMIGGTLAGRNPVGWTYGDFWLFKINNGLFPAGINTKNIKATNVYPTVTNDVINVECSSSVNTRLTMTDMLGKMIPVAAEKNNENYTIDMSGLADGMYILQVRDGEQVSNHKIIYRK